MTVLRDKKTHLKKRAFVAAYARSGNVSLSAEAAGIDRGSHYRWLSEDEDYRKQIEDAADEAADRLEAEARRRAEQGVRKLKFDPKTGKPYVDPETGEPYVEHEYSDTLLIFLLKGLKPERYRERQDVTVKHSGEVVQRHEYVDIQQLDREDRRKFADYIRKVRSGSSN